MSPSYIKQTRVAALLYIFLSLMTRCPVQAQPSLDEGPQDVTVRSLGATVNFICNLRNVGGYIIYWFHLERNTVLTILRQVGTYLSPSLKSRLSIIGDVNNEEFTLRIENVTVADDGEYFCQYASPSDPNVKTNATATENPRVSGSTPSPGTIL